MIDGRQHRQRILAEVGATGQQRLEQASVAIVGVGGLGSPVALYLAAAGVGRLGLVDDQRVELSNLNRQIIFEECDVGRPKVEAAAGRLRLIDAGIQLDARQENIRASNVAALFAEYDLVVDGSDAFETKFLLNDAAVLLRKPLVHGAVLQWGGQVTTVLPDGPCLRCLFRDPPEPGRSLQRPKKEDQRRSGAKSDIVAQGIQLGPELALRAQQPGDATIEPVEYSGEDDRA